MTVGRGEVDGAGIAGGDVAEGIERGDGDRTRGAGGAIGRNGDHEMRGGGGRNGFRIRGAGDGRAHRIGRGDGLVAGGIEGVAEGGDAVGQRHVGRQRGEAVAGSEVDGARIAGGDIAEGIERGDGGRTRRPRRTVGGKRDREVGGSARRDRLGVGGAGDGAVGRVGRGDGLAARGIEGLAEGAHSIGQRRVRRQRGEAVGRGEVDSAGIAGGDIAQGVICGDGDRLCRARRPIGRKGDHEMRGGAGRHGLGVRGAGDAGARRVGGGDGLAADSFEGLAEGADAVGQRHVDRQHRMPVGRGEVDGAGVAGGDVTECIERGHGHRAWRPRCAVARNADHEMGSGTSLHRFGIRSAVDAGADRVGRGDGLVAGGVESLAEMADAIGQRHVGRQRGEAVGRGEVDGAGVAGGDVAEGIERGDGDRTRRSRRAVGRKVDREMGGGPRRHGFGVRCTGDGVVDRVGGGNGLAACAIQGLAEAAGAVGQRHVGRQRRVPIGRAEVDRASVIRDDVVQGVERSYGDRAGRPSCAIGRDAHGKVSGSAQCHVDREGLRAAQRAIACRRGDGIGVARRGGEIDLARIGDGDHARRGIDGKAAARTVAGQAVGHRIHVGR